MNAAHLQARRQAMLEMWLPTGGLILLCAILYSYTLSYAFVFDDCTYLVANPLFKQTSSFWLAGGFAHFANASKNLGLDPDLSTNFILRPLGYLSFHLNYLCSGLEPAGYRAVNIAIHCLNAVLLFELVKRLLGEPREDSSRGFIALSAAVLFAFHPLQIESVTYVIQRFTSLSASFYLWVTLMFVVSRTTANPGLVRWGRRLSVAGLWAGLLVKEVLFTAPLVLVLLDWLVLGAPLRQACRRIVPWLWPLPLIPLLIVATSAAQNPGGASLSAAFNITNPYERTHYPLQYAMTQPGVVLTYLRLLFVPVGLNIDPDYPLAHSFSQWRVWGALLGIIAMVTAAGLFWWRDRTERRRTLLFFGVLWYFITICIDSSVVPLPDVMAEHRAYLPGMGIFLAVASLADIWRTGRLAKVGWAVPMAVGLWALALYAATFYRNQAWRSETAIWSDTVLKSPNKARPWLNLGTAEAEAGYEARAVECFRRVIALEPKAVPAYTNLAYIYTAGHRPDQALEILQLGLRTVPASAPLHFAAGVVQRDMGHTAQAEELFQKVVAIAPGHWSAHLELAIIYHQRREYLLALKHLKAAGALYPLSEANRQVLSQLEAFAAQGAKL